MILLKKRIYHGSDHIIEQPVFGEGKRYNDYGLGFYCTEVSEMAKEWAVDRNRDGYANCYEIDDTELMVLKLNGPEFCTLHWLAVLLENREFDVPSGLAREAKRYLLEHFLPEYEKYDIIIGYRADDSYFSFAQDFINGTISYRQLSEAMKLGRLGWQYVLKSKKAFGRVRYVGNEPAFAEDWYAKKEWRDKNARRQYFQMDRDSWQREIYITRILDEEMKSDDPRLR